MGRSSKGTERGKERPHLLSNAFPANLRAVWKSEFPPSPSLSPAFLRDLQDAYEADGRDDSSPEELEDLGARLDTLATDCEERLQKALKGLHRDHPVKCPISLFGTMSLRPARSRAYSDPRLAVRPDEGARVWERAREIAVEASTRPWPGEGFLPQACAR